jgi:hypothetical protein
MKQFEQLESRLFFSISHDTSVIKVPGPTDTVVVTATNPSGNQVPGQSTTFTVSNKDAKLFK